MTKTTTQKIVIVIIASQISRLPVRTVYCQFHKGSFPLLWLVKDLKIDLQQVTDITLSARHGTSKNEVLSVMRVEASGCCCCQWWRLDSRNYRSSLHSLSLKPILLQHTSSESTLRRPRAGIKLSRLEYSSGEHEQQWSPATNCTCLVRGFGTNGE